MDYNNVNTWRMDQDNRRRATEILIGAPVGNAYHETAYREKREASRDEILSRVRIVGVFKAAQEYRIRPKVIRRWMEKEGLNNNSMSKDTMKKKATPEEHVVASQQATVPQEDTQQEDTQKNPAPQNTTPQNTTQRTTKKSKDFSPEERETILERAKKIGTRKAAAEAGTTRYVVMNWQSHDPNYKKAAESTPMPKEIIPGTDGLPPRRERIRDYSAEEKKLIVAKADEVGNGPVVRAYGLHSYTPRDWRRPGKKGLKVAAPKKAMMKKTTETVQEQKKPIALGAHANQAAQPVVPAEPMHTVLPVTSAVPAAPSTTAAPSAPVTPAAPVHTPAPAESVVTAVPVVTAQELSATPTQELVDPVPPSTPVAPIASAATIHTDVPAPQGQAYERPTPMYTLPSAPVAPMAPDTIEMIRLKDRIKSLEERVETLRKVILDLI